MTPTLLTMLVVYLVAVNVAAFAAFGADKRHAKRGEWRIPERRLLALAAAGGGAGALAGAPAFRHKTRKPLFAVGVPVILVAQAAFLAWALAASGAVPGL